MNENEFLEWLNKKCKVFIKNLSDEPIVYTGTLIDLSENFITILDKKNKCVKINVHDIILIRELEKNELDSFKKGG